MNSSHLGKWFFLSVIYRLSPLGQDYTLFWSPLEISKIAIRYQLWFDWKSMNLGDNAKLSEFFEDSSIRLEGALELWTWRKKYARLYFQIWPKTLCEMSDGMRFRPSWVLVFWRAEVRSEAFYKNRSCSGGSNPDSRHYSFSLRFEESSLTSEHVYEYNIGHIPCKLNHFTYNYIHLCSYHNFVHQYLFRPNEFKP